MGRKHFLASLGVGASLLLAAAPAHAAPPIAYTMANNQKSVDLFLVNPDGTGKIKLYTTAKGANIRLLDMNPNANQLAILESSSQHLVKIIDYDSAGVAGTITILNDPCLISGIDFHPTDGSLLVSHWCQSTDTLEVRQWSNEAFDSQPLATFGTSSNAIGQVHWLGDASGFLIYFAHPEGTTQQRQIDRYMIGTMSAPVTVVVLPRSAVGEFDTARCTTSSTGPCWAMAYDDGAGQVHKVHFDAMSTTEDSVQAGSSPHYSPDNSQLLYRLQTHAGYYLKVDNFTLVSKAAVYAPLDWHQ